MRKIDGNEEEEEAGILSAYMNNHKNTTSILSGFFGPIKNQLVGGQWL